jgi:Spy/CpxP family protein refolding chaperone
MATIEGGTKMKLRSLLCILPALLAGTALAQHGGHGASATPYAGLQSRDIKALSPEEERGLLEGQGMRLALAAELNGYPGPAHVLEHADSLQLRPEQRRATQALMDTHKAEARALGAQAIEAERQLDLAFAQRTVTEAELARLTGRIGELQAQLRAAHLRTHLQQTALLTPRQVAHYQRLRGYTTAGPGTHQGKH